MNLRRILTAGRSAYLIAVGAFAQSDFKTIAWFDEGSVAHLGITVEYKQPPSKPSLA